MKKFSIFVAFLLLGIVGMQAAPVDVAKARKVADRYVRISGLYDKTQKVNRVVDITTQTPFTAFYVFRIEGTRSGKGFVLVSADDIARPVLGYSAESDFVAEGMPEHVAAWLREYEQQITRGREAGLGTHPLWERMLNSDRERMENTVVVDALLQTQWGQIPRYNNLCPYDNEENERTVTGCVATAMGQILRYWSYPTHGIGSHSYMHNTYGMQSADFSATNYDWANMPVQLTASSSTTQINAVATLLYHCGVAVNMNYGTSSAGGSGATTVGNTPGAATAENAFKNYFDYVPTLHGVSRSSYNEAAWKQLLMGELDASRPMMYRGSGSDGGHAFVCDGYDSDTNFHFNWGWSGSYNGFFAVTALTPGGYSFTDGQQAVIGIQPANSTGLTPRDLHASHISNNGATLTWVDRNMATGTTFQVVYGPAATFDTNSSATYTSTTTTGESLALTGLTANTAYKVAIRITAGNTHSNWSDILDFSTIGAPQAAPALVGFESGLPSGWGQEYVSGNIAWTTANGGHSNNPAAALTGSSNALLWTGARGSSTKLVSPMLTLSGSDNMDRTANTIHKVAFGHAQMDWSGDIDMLSVYYRTSPSAEWMPLASYTEEIANWQRDTLTLPNPSGTYQVAFEGELHWGYGVCLDDISFFTETEVNDSIVVSDVILACDSYTVTDNNGTRTFTQTGTYRLVYTAVSGIDSIILRTVVIGHPTHNSTTVTEIGRYIWHDVIYTESGTYTYNYTNNYGCACADTLHLTIVPCTTEYRNQYVEACDEYTWSNYVTYYESTTEAYDTLTVDGGCPLIMRLNLTIYHSTHNNYSATAMNTYTWHDSLYFETGAFPYHYLDQHDCPSADTLHLTITPAPAVVVDSLHPYHENFEGDFTWYLQSGTAVNRWAYGTATANGGTHALYISNDRGHTNHYDITKRSIAYASKLFTLGRGTHYIGYDWKCYGENNYDYLRVFLAPASAHFNGDSLPSGNPTAATNTYLHTVPDGWITLDDSSKLNMQSNWQSFTAEANVTTPGDYRLVFLWIDDASVGTDPPAAIDDISIELVNCGRPSNLAVNNIHTNTATVSWIGTGTQYQVAYGTGTDPDQMTLLTSSDSTVTLTGLSGGTTYHVYVRNICSPTLSSAWSGMATFSTPYPPVVVDETHPFSDGFENPCTWWLINGDRTNRWYWGTAASNGGSHSIYISNNSGNNNTYNNGSTGVTYATKLFALKSGTYHVGYDWRANGERTNNGTNYDYLRVFLAPAATTVTAGTTLPNGTTSTSGFSSSIPTGWIVADSGHYMNKAESWQHFESDVAIPDSGDYVLLFVWITDGSAGDNPPAAVDNVSLTRPNCAEPSNIRVTSVFSTTATLAWNGNGNTFRIAYGEGEDLLTMSQVQVTGTSHTLTGLSPDTQYNVYVRGICDDNTQTQWMGPVVINTPCTPYTITTSNSLTENFEGGLPDCWRAIYPCDNNAIITTTNISSSTSYNNSHSLRFSSYNTCSGGYYQYFISQEISCAAPMQLSFHYRDYSQSNHLYVGYSTTGNNPEHFTTWEEVPNSEGEWYSFTGEVPHGTKYVSFRYHGNNSFYSYVDDIELRWARYLITAVSSDSTQGTVSGSSTRFYNATATIRAFPTACYQFSHWNDGNTANPRTVTVTQDSTFTAYFTPATLTGSETVAACESYRWGGTTYRNSGTYTRHVTTAAGCDSVATLHLTINHGTHNVVYDTTSSIPYIWHDSSYTTAGVYTYNYTNAAGCASTDTLYLEISNPCPALSTLPYTENFDTLSNGYSETFVPCWHRVSYAYSVTAAYPFVSSIGRNNTNGLYWSHATNATDYEYVALPAIDTTLHPIRTLKLTFWARATSNQPRIEVGVMSDPEDTNTFVPVRLLSIESSTWTSRTTYFNNYNGHGQYLALRGRSSNANWSACLDEFTIDVAPACIEPVDIVALTTTATTATLSWQGSAQSYTIAYGTGNNPAVMDSVSSNSNSVTLSGLTANTEYHVFGRSYCSNGQHSGWSEMYTFHTECASITTLPYSEGFENANTGSLTAPNFTVECWKRFTNGTTYYAPFVSTIRHAGSKGLSWTLYSGETYGTSHFVVLPGIEVPNRTLNALRVSFWGRVNTAAGQCPFQVGVMTDINDTNTFIPVSTVMVTGNTWTEYTIDLAPYTGTGIYIALRNLTPASNLVAYTDDFTVSVAPTCFPPDSVIFSNITSHSATATWSANAGSYVVAYGTGTNPDAMDSLVVTSGTATLDNLTSNTDYHVFVRSVCNDERSVWSAMYTFHTECGINALPFTDGFESYSAGSVSNATFTASCWTRHNNASSYHVPFVGTTGRTSTRGITWNMNGTVSYGTSHYLVLPAVEVPGQAVNTLQLTFWARCYSNNSTNHFQVGVMTDRNDTNTFTPVSDVTINSGSWTEFTTYLIPYTGTGKYIALRSREVRNGNNVFFDDFTVDLAPTCFPPTGITVSGITANSATVAWTGTAGTYKVAYGTGTNPDAMDYVTVTGSSTTLTGLTPMTDYNVYLQSVCPDTHSFWSEATTFTTACGRIIAFPFTEDFEGYPTGSTSTANADFGVPCWTHINNGSIYTGSPYIFYSQHHSGTQSLWWQMPNYNNAQWPSYQMLVLPGVDNTIDLRELRLTCWIGGTSNLNANSIFYVGVMTDPNNVNTFTQVATVPLESSSWQEYHVDFNGYNGNGKYIALRTVRSNAFWGASMDDVTLDYIPPTVIDTVAVACDSFTWNNTTYYTSGNYTRPHTEHNITVYDTLHLTINHGTHNVEYDTAEASYTWHGTTYNTTGVYTYNYTNTEGCASTDTLYLEIIDPYAPVLVDETHPFYDGFEEAVVRWQMFNGELSNKWVVGSATSNGGDKALYISNSNGATNEYTVASPVAVFAAKTFILPAGHYYFSYDWQCNGESTFDYLRVALAPVSATLTPSTNNGYPGITTTAVPSGWISLDGNQKKNLSNSWQTYMAEANITTAGNYQMVFYWRNDNSGGFQPPAAVDNVNIIKSSCMRPTNIAASNITDTAATLTWNGSASSYEVAYGTTTDVASMTPQTVNGTTLQLSGLSPSNNYNVYVRAICSATEQSPWSNVYNFTTDCGALTALPYLQGFEESTSGSSTSFNVNCWSRYTSSGNYPYVYNSTTYAHTGAKSLYWYSSNSYTTQYIVMPEVETTVLPINTLRLKFWTKVTSNNPTLMVGVMTNPADPNTFTTIQSVNCGGNTEFQGHIINLSSYTGTGRYIAIRALTTNNWTVYVDDFTLEEIPSCPEPTNITTAATTTTRATLAWTQTNANSYTVAYGTGTNPNSMDTVRVNASTVTLTGLNASTEYHVYVRSNCTGESSQWSLPHTFRTQCGLLTSLPYSENINGATTSSSVFDIPCWQRLASSYYPYATTSAGRSGNGLTWYCPSSPGAYQYAILPGIDTNLNPIRTLKLTFWARSSSTNYQPRIQVGVMSNPMDTHSFVPVRTIDLVGTTWTEQTVYFNTYTGNGINIALRGVQTSSNWYAYLDDFIIDTAPTCIEPTLVAAANITATSANLSWQGTAQSYTVAYGTGVTPTGMANQTTSATSLALTGLTPNTEYHVFVRSKCTGGLQSEWSTIYTFRTECNAITTLPYTEGFEGYSTSSTSNSEFTVDCWKRHTNGTAYYVPYVSTQAHTGNRGLNWYLYTYTTYGTSQYVVLPRIEVAGQSTNTLQLSFWARCSSTTAVGTYQVGVMTDNNDTNTFTPIGTVTVTGTGWTEYTTRLTSYTGTGTYIALRSRNTGISGYAYFDDFTVDVAPTCDTPTNIAVNNITATAATVTWNGNSPNYQVAYGTGNDIASMTFVNCSTATIQLTGLTPNTEYHLYVRGVCSFGNSAWSSMVTFSTICPVIPSVVTTETACESYTWHDTVYTATGNYTFDTLVDGCPRTDTLHLTINYGTHNADIQTACESYTWHGQTYPTSDTYTYNYTNADGCASTDTLHLTINYGTHNSVTEMVDESYTWHGSVYTATGVYTHSYTNADGCASTDTLHLTVDPFMPILVNETHPFHDGFERAILHWQVANGTQTNQWHQGTAAHSNGNKALYISNDNGTTNAYNNLSASTVFATKQFILPAGHFYFSYDWRANGESGYDYMRAYLTPANTTFTDGTLPSGVSATGTPAGWTVLDRGRQMNMSSNWSNNTAEVNITDSAIYQVVFIWYNDYSAGSQPPAGIDEVVFIKSDCQRPTALTAQSIGTTTATLTWTGTAANYQVAYGTTPFLADMDTLTVSGTTATLTGLAHTTTHYAYVRTLCNANEASGWSTVCSFRTACGLIALPYSYGFEDASMSGANGTINECWHKGTNVPTTNNYPYPYSYETHAGYYALYMNAEASYYSYVVLPMFDNPLNRTQLTFWGRATSSNYPAVVEIGVVTNPTDITTFQQYATFDIPRTGVLQWHCDTVMFDSYQGNGQYIALRLQGGGNSRCYLDDFTVEAMPECSGVRNLAVAGTTDNSVTLTWHETGAATSWDVEYGPRGFLQGSGTLITVNDTTATITGLTNNTWYDFYVHSDCLHATSRGQRISGQTDCGLAAIPFLEDFNGYAGSNSNSPISRCWYKCYSQGNNQTSYPMFTYSSNDNSDYFLYFLSTSYYYSYLVLPYMQGNIHDQMLRFKVKTSGGVSANIQVGVMTTATNFNTFQQVQQFTRSTDNEWTIVNVPFNNLSGTNYRIAIVSPRLTASGSQSQSFYVDDIEVVPIPDCNAPASLTAGSITTTSATLNWSAAQGISRYRVVYTPHGDYDSTYRVTVDSVAATSLPLTGLQMGTTYDVEVYSLCITGSLSTAATTTFSTSCSAHSVPFTENFDHGAGTHVSPCWNNGFYGAATSTYPTVSPANSKYEGDKGLLFFSSSNNMYSYAILPELDDTLSLLQFKLQARTGNGNNPNASLQIGTVASSANITTFQTVQNIQLNNSWQYFTVPLTSVADNSRRLAIRYQPNGGQGQAGNVLVDDIIVERIPACNGPARVTADHIVYNGARLHWPAATGIASYSLEYGPSGFTPGQGTQVNGLTDTLYTLTGLTPGTAYSVYLWAACNSWSQSSLVSTSFSTGCLEDLPYTYGFEGLANTNNSSVTSVPCWFLNENVSVQYNRNTQNYAGEGYSRMRFNIGSNNTTAYAVMPKLDERIENLYMTLQVNTAESYFMDPLAPLHVGVMTDPYDFSTFTEVASLLPTTYNSWQSFRVDFDNLTGDNYYIAFYASRTNTYVYNVYLDDIRVIRIAPHDIDLTVVDPARGTVSINGVTATHGQALAGSNVTLTATANHGYTFSHWAAGVTDNPYTFVMPDHDVVYNHIVFSLNTYTVTALSNDTTLGSVTGGGTFDYLDTATLTATPIGNYNFLRWSDGVTTNPRTLIVTDDTTLTALFQNGCPTGTDTTVYACESYTWHGQTYTATGDYTYERSTDQCTIVDTLHLIISNGTNTAYYATACDSYTWHGTTYSASGSYTFDTLLLGICPRTDTLHLTVNHSTHNSISETVYESYTWHGITYTATGVYTYEYTNADGCASTDTLHLTVDPYLPVLVDETHPFNDGFEGETLHWQLLNGTLTNKWRRGSAAYSGGNHSLYISNNGLNNQYSITNPASVFATKTFILPAGHYYFSYDWRCYGETNDFMRVALVPTSETLTPGTNVYPGISTSLIPSGWISLDGYNRKNLSNDWQYYLAEADITTAGNYQMVFYWYNNYNFGAQPPAAVDNVNIIKSSCALPTNIAASNITGTTATLTWSGTAGSYQVAYGTTNNVASMTPQTVNGTTLQLSGLSPSRKYYVYIRSICSATEQSPWSNFYNFTTQCGATTALPYQQDFEECIAGMSPSFNVNCWNRYTSWANYPYVYNNTSYAHSGTKCLQWSCYSSNITQYIVMPEVETTVLPINTLRLKFWIIGSSSPRFMVGVMTDPADINTFTTIQTVNCDGNYEYQEQIINLSGYTGTGRYIAISAVPAIGEIVYFDDFILEEIPACPEPTNITSVAVATTATLAWTGTNAESYTVAYGTDNNPNIMDTVRVNGSTVTLTDLNANTEYHVYVRANCPGESSNWSNPHTFRTQCELITTLPYYEDFNSVTHYSSMFDIPCWLKLEYGGNIQVSSYAGRSGAGLDWLCPTESSQYAILPAIDPSLYPIRTLKLTFWVKSANSNRQPSIQVGVMSNPIDTNTFTPISTIDLVGTTWTEKTVYFNTYTGNGINIAVRGRPTADSWIAYMDDFTIDYIPQPIDTTVVACDSFTWGDATYTTSGIHTRPRLVHGHTVYDTLHLTIHHSTTGVDVVDACDSLTWIDGNSYRVSTTLPTYTITNAAGCDSTVTLNLTINHSTTGSESIIACDSYTWNGTTHTASGVYTYNTLNAAGCDSTATLNLTVNHGSTSSSTAAACESYTWHDSTYIVTGIYTFDTLNAAGCDSTATLHLTVNHGTTGSESVTVCDTYTWHGMPYTATGVYTFDTLNANGCDSTATLHLTVNHSTAGVDQQTACESFRWINGVTYTSSTNTPTFTLTNHHRCDSVVTLNLTINYHSTMVLNRTVCDSITWHGGTYYYGGTYHYDTLNAEGCDSLTTLVLTVNRSTHDNYYQNSCGSYQWYGTTYTTSGTYTYDYTNTVGCASTDTLHLVIDQHTDTSFYVTACDGYRWNDSLYTMPGVYTYNYSTAGSTCTNVDTLFLFLNYSTSDTFDVTTCDSYTWHDSTYVYPYPSGYTYPYTSVYTYATTTVAGCDSVETLNLTLKRSVTGADILTACDSYTWINGITYTTSNYNTSNYTVEAANGCDSVVTLFLTLNHSTTGDENVTACDSYTWHGTAYTASGVYTFDTTNATGCDSTARLTLTVNHSTTGNERVTVCDSYTWHGTEYTATGVYTFDTLNAAGCDSTVTLTLTVNHSSTGIDRQEACDQYIWIDGNTYTASTTSPTHTFTNSEGCDSVVTLDLTINNSLFTEVYDTACEQYIWLGNPISSLIYDESGDYSFTTTATTGCDSTVTLHLTIHHGTHDNYYQHACDTFTWHGTAYTVTGTYLYEYTNDLGCASTDTLHLTVDQHSDTAYHVTLCDSVYRWNDSVFTESGIYIYDYSLAGSTCTNVDTLYLTLNRPAYTDIWDTACDGYNWVGTVIPEGDWYHESGTYTRNLQTIHGCDSIATLHLTIHHSSTLDTTLVACDTLLWTVGDTTFSIAESGDYIVGFGYFTQDLDPPYPLVLTQPLTNAEGCDSMQLLHVTINHSYRLLDTAAYIVTACDSYLWHGTIYTADGIYTFDTVAANGCDSTLAIDLTLRHSSNGVDSVTACDSYTWIDGVTYTASTAEPVVTLANAEGCDSVLTLDLTVNYGQYTSTYQAACDSLVWHDSVYTLSGTYLYYDMTAEGCPMVDTLVLTVSNGTSTGYHVDACDRYVWNGTEYTETGNYIYDYSTTGGDCENVDTLYLTIHHSANIEVFDTACDSYTWFGTVYTSSTSATSTTSTVFGCDSTVTLHLTLHYNSSTAYTDSLGADGTYTWHGVTYTEGGTYTYDYFTDEGCASTDTLYLMGEHLPVYYTLHARSADTTMGYVVVYPDSVALSGDTVIVVGVPHEGYRFTHWSDGDTNGARILLLSSDTTLVAYFEVYVGIAEVEIPEFRLWTETGVIHVEGTGINGMPVRAYDLQGRMLYDIRAEGDQVTINTARWATGVYLVRVGHLPAQRVVLR